MNRTIAGSVLVLGLFLPLVSCSKAPSAAGNYIGQFDLGQLPPKLTLTIAQKGPELSGSGTVTYPSSANPEPLKFDFTGKLTGSHVQLQIPKMGNDEMVLEGELQGDEIKGNAAFKRRADAPPAGGAVMKAGSWPFRVSRS